MARIGSVGGGWLGGEAKNLSKHLQSSYHQFKTIRCIAEGLAHAEHHQLLHENSSKHPWGAFEASKVCSNTSLQRCTQQHPFSINPRYSYSNPLSSKRKSVHQVYHFCLWKSNALLYTDKLFRGNWMRRFSLLLSKLCGLWIAMAMLTAPKKGASSIETAMLEPSNQPTAAVLFNYFII